MQATGEKMATAINELEKERDRYREALNDLLKEAEAFEGMSKHLDRKCQKARKILLQQD